jgi:hypothetical protein
VLPHVDMVERGGDFTSARECGSVPISGEIVAAGPSEVYPLADTSYFPTKCLLQPMQVFRNKLTFSVSFWVRRETRRYLKRSLWVRTETRRYLKRSVWEEPRLQPGCCVHI